MRICICSPNKDVYSETFIRAHIRALPDTLPLYGDWPLWEHQSRPIISTAARFLMNYGARVHGAVAAAARRWAVGRLASFFRRHKVDVVLAEYGTTAVGLMEPCRLAGVPLVAHFHGADAYHHDTLAEQKEGYQRLFATAAGIITGARAMERHLLALGAPPDRLFYNPCGVDVAAFQASDPGHNPPEFIAVGRFVDKKAPYIPLLAFQRVRERCPEARLIYIGEGYLLDTCRQLSRALGLQAAVEFLGRRSPPEVAASLRSARAFVQHSVTATYGDSEGTGISILEAGACGLPVVSTRHGGIQDTVIEGETGFLVDELDIDGMADRMATLATDADLASHMGARARRHVERNHSLDRSIRGLASILETAAAAR
jgi:glycosyltransferase involved in cell wall biosynthesis